MTLFELIVMVGMAELLAMAWMLGALAWPRETGWRRLGLGTSVQGRPGRAGQPRAEPRRVVTEPPLRTPRPEHRESVPGG